MHAVTAPRPSKRMHAARACVQQARTWNTSNERLVDRNATAVMSGCPQISSSGMLRTHAAKSIVASIIALVMST
jgi:hypothetical protein